MSCCGSTNLVLLEQDIPNIIFGTRCDRTSYHSIVIVANHKDGYGSYSAIWKKVFFSNADGYLTGPICDEVSPKIYSTNNEYTVTLDINTVEGDCFTDIELILQQNISNNFTCMVSINKISY